MKSMPRLVLWIVAPLLTFSHVAMGDVRPAVVELFTSEGCSSCPPAEAYTAELAQRSDVLPLTFHVNYWDNLGWPDRFSSPEATQRQRTYAQTLRLSSVFTPQTVIDGRRSFVGSDRKAISRELLVPRDGPPIALAEHDGDITIGLGSFHSATPGEVLLLGLRHSAVTPIGRGENAGRTITEVNIVRTLRTLGRWEGRPMAYHVRVDSLAPDSTDVAVLIQAAGQSSIIGAATLALPPDNRMARSTAAP